MSIAGLIRRLVVNRPLTAADHDANLTAIETAVDSKADATATQAALNARASTGPIGSSGLTMTAGVLGQSGTGPPVVLTLSGLSIVNGVLTVTASGSGTVTSVAMSVPTGFSVAGSPITTTGTLALTFAAGYSLPLDTRQTDWDTAFTQRRTWDGGSSHLNAATGRASLELGTAAQAATGDFATAAQGTDSREWSAATVTQAEAEAGIATTRRAFTPLRVFQSIAAYIAANFSAVGQALATATSAAAARTTLGLGTAAQSAASDFLPRTIEIVNVAYAATINIDFAANHGKVLVVDTLTGDLTFTFSNIAEGRKVSVDLLCGSTQRTLTFPGSTPFLGPKPFNIAASKAARVAFECVRGATEAGVRAGYSVQS